MGKDKKLVLEIYKKRTLVCMESGTLQTCYQLWSRSGFPYYNLTPLPPPPSDTFPCSQDACSLWHHSPYTKDIHYYTKKHDEILLENFTR